MGGDVRPLLITEKNRKVSVSNPRRWAIHHRRHRKSARKPGTVTWSAAPALETRAVGWFKDRLIYRARLYSKKQKQQTKKKSGAD